MLISFAVTAKLICVFVFTYAKCWFFLDAAHLCFVFSNVSTLAQAQAAPLMDDGASRFGGGDNVCQHCGKAVFFAEQALGGNKVYILFVEPFIQN